MIGNAHIDPIWLWRWQAGVDEALATFLSSADRCDEYPEFVVTRGESWLYRQVERLDPELFARVRGLIERGQWHVTGGQVVQPDCNLPTAMGWRRQLAHGRRYFESRFGIRPNVVYNVDSFGHPATLPDLLAELGVVGYVFRRPEASQVALPAQLFRWRGPRGGELLGFRIGGSYVTRSDNLFGQIALALEATDPAVGHTMCFYGVGNHGGGPTKANIEYILEHRDSFPGAELRFSTPQAFFDAVSPLADRLAIVEQELQQTFPGCYSVMHGIKRAQRHGEQLLDQAERAVAAFVPSAGEAQELHSRLDAAWDDLLFTEFHDVLAGTSTPSAWESVRAMQGRARILGEEVLLDATRRWARRALPRCEHQQIAVVNSSEAPFRGFVQAEPFLDFDVFGARWLADPQGQPIDFQLVQPEPAVIYISRVLFPAEVEPASALQLQVRSDEPPPREPVATDLDVSSARLANGRVEALLSGRGVDGLAVDGRQLLGTDGIRLQLRTDSTDTWAVSTDRFVEPVQAIFETGGWVVEEAGPLRARVRLEGELGHSWLRWTIDLYRGEPRLCLTLETTWSERFALLQLAIVLGESPDRWQAGLAGGFVERAASEVEWPVQGWSRLRLRQRELALVTNDAYSLRLHEGVWQWTLLRSPRMAWFGPNPTVYGGRDWHTDQGAHLFQLELIGGEALAEEELEQAVQRQAQPLVVFDRYEGMARPPWGPAPPPHLEGEAERLARDQDAL